MNLKKREWFVVDVPFCIGKELVEKYHYAGGGSNTGTYMHGLFKKGSDVCWGVAWWIPPTKTAANFVFPKNWRGVLSLSRLVVHPDCPKNSASFLIGSSVGMVDRERWPCLVTYADEWRGHTGAIYRATNWEYRGKTRPERTYVIDGKMVSRKAGPRTRTHGEMMELGAKMVGSFSKHRFVMEGQ